ncbi:MAG: hypothetical protein EHM55_14465 [Acidobacteria bacterium]|nr:MAG: hypothetical protein EHM55_14465 [Acidobacteriota bacterium]
MPSAPDELSEFVKAALARGVSRAEIEAALRQAGWTIDQTRMALAGYADSDFPIPVPKPRPYLDAREAFMYLVLFSTLYWSAYHLGSLLFDIINLTFPDPAADRERLMPYIRSSMRWSVSSLVVAFPVFLYMSWLVARDIGADPNKRHSKVRRWLTYMTLFFASGIIIGDVITLLYNLLGGEITIRFLLKALVVAFIAGTVFWYYLSDIRREE